MVIKNSSEINVEKWISLVQACKYATPFQTPEFYEFYNSIDGFSANVFAIEEQNEYKALVFVTIQKEQGLKSFFSRRGIIYGGPLIQENGHDYLANLLKEINSYYKGKLIYLEIRNNFNLNGFDSVFNRNKFFYQPHLNVQLKTIDSSMEIVLANMKYNRRREINISYKEGAVVNEAKNENEVSDFFEILNDLYKNRVKLPMPNLDYFIALYKSKIGKVFIVKHDNKIIGGSFCIYYNNMSIYTLYYAGIRDYHKKIFPTHLAIVGVTEFAIKNNLKMVDFMGAGKPGEEYGVRDYKLEFGGELVEHGRYLNILNPFLYHIGALGLKVLSKIK